MTKLDRLIHDTAEFYDKPFSKLPPGEQIYLASKAIEIHEAEAELFADEAGVLGFQNIAMTLRGLDYESAGRKFALLIISQSGVEKAYNSALAALKETSDE